MKKIIFLFVIFLFFGLTFDVYAADIYFVWNNTEIIVPVGSNIDDYKDKVEVSLYVNGLKSNDFKISYEEEGTTFSTVLTNRVGKYRINYRAYSKTYNISQNHNIYFIVSDLIAPIISGPDMIEIPFSSDIDASYYYQVNDNYDKKEDILLSIDLKDVSLNVLGIYPAKVIAKDMSLNTTEKMITIKIVDKEKPVIKLLQPLLFSYGKEIKKEDFFLVTDNYDGNITANLDITYDNILGNQMITATAVDSSQNMQTQQFLAKVIDDISPTLELKMVSSCDISAYSDVEELIKDLVIKMEDNYSSKDKLVLKYKTDLDLDRVGTYKIYYQLFDENNNVTSKEIEIFLREKEGPKISSKDLYTFSMNENINYQDLVEVKDSYDINAKDNLIITSNNVDSTKEGLYEVTFECINSSGRKTTKTVNIQILADQKTKILSYLKDNYILVLIIASEIIMMTFFIIYMKKKKKTNKDN